jgi:acyl transferase domain-containing protein
MLFRSCYAPDAAPRRLYVRFGCFVERVNEFDSAAFRLSYMEAAATDPQCRILLVQTAVRTAQSRPPIARSPDAAAAAAGAS